MYAKKIAALCMEGIMAKKDEDSKSQKERDKELCEWIKKVLLDRSFKVRKSSLAGFGRNKINS